MGITTRRKHRGPPPLVFCLNKLNHGEPTSALTRRSRLPTRFQRLAQVLGMRAQLVERVRFEQVVDRRVGKRVSDERALAGLAGPEQEDGAVLDEGAEIQGATVHPAILLLIFMKFSNSIAGFQRRTPAGAPETLQRRLEPLDDFRVIRRDVAGLGGILRQIE